MFTVDLEQDAANGEPGRFRNIRKPDTTMKIAGVRFRENWRVYDFDATDIAVSVGDDVIVESDRGQGFARVVRLREGDALPLPQKYEQEPKAQNGPSARKNNGQEQEEEIEV